MKMTAKIRRNPRIKELHTLLLEFSDAEMKVILKKVDTEFRRTVEIKSFATEGRATGSKWPALSDRYKKWKKKNYPGRKIMTLTGGLRRSLTHKGNADHIAEYDRKPPVIRVGTKNELAAYHGDYESRNPRLPVRDVVQMKSSQHKLLTNIVKHYIVKVKLRQVATVLRAAQSVKSRV